MSRDGSIRAACWLFVLAGVALVCAWWHAGLVLGVGGWVMLFVSVVWPVPKGGPS